MTADSALQRARILFAGTAEFGAVQLRTLLDAGVSPLAVLTQPPRPAGRGLRRRDGPVAALAAERGLPLLQPARLDPAALQPIEALKPQLLLVAAYGLLLPPPLLALPEKGCVNVHASLLPKYRGAAPVQWAILNGERRSGISFMLMDEGLDTGPVLERHPLQIPPDCDTGALTALLADLAAGQLPQLLERWLGGEVQPQPQREAEACPAPALRTEDARLDFADGAEQLHRRVRAFAPRPGAWCRAGDRRLKVLRSRPLAVEAPADAGEPGSLFCPGRARLAVVCGRGALELALLQLEGGRPVSGADLLNARRPGLIPGAVLR